MALGRPSKLTPEVIEKLVASRRTGISYRACAALADIVEATLMDWLRQGRNDAAAGLDTLHAQLSGAMEKANAENEGRYVGRVHGGELGWQGSAWLLERTMRDRYGRELPPAPPQQVDGPKTPEELVEQLAEKVPAKLLEDALARARSR